MAHTKSSAAVQYVRMSTDSQELSPAVQREAIGRYADQNNLTVIRSYEDEGKSGLSLKQRPAMRQLLADVMNVECGFGTVLVYDVSRWGRFQDTDASAYYEYHCRLHGVQVVYVVEPFVNDGLPFTTLLKSMKRAMAAEYSRELKVKTRSGQDLAIRRGFQMGKLPSIGLRRMSVPSDGSTGRELRPNERKPKMTDRVRWVQGPAAEIELVRHIFKMYAETNITIKRLVANLAHEGRCDSEGRPFTHRMVSTLLKCEAFTGTFVWGKRDDRTGVRRMPGDKGYTRVEDVIEPLVSRALWERAQQKRRLDQNRRRTKAEAIEELREALRASPNFSTIDLPGSGCATEVVYRRLFGSFTEALRLAGRDDEQCKAALAQKVARMRHIGAVFRRDLMNALKANGIPFVKQPRSNTFVFNSVTRVAVQIIWRRKGRHGLTWWLKKHFARTCEYVLVVRMEDNETALDFLILETRHYVAHPPWFHEPDKSALQLTNATELVAALASLPCISPYVPLMGAHRRLRYVTPLPIEIHLTT